MFSFVQFGALEILSVFVVCTVAGVIGLFRPTAWRWLAVMASILMIAIICTPADLLSLWLVATPTFAVFAVGVILSPYLGGPTRTS